MQGRHAGGPEIVRELMGGEQERKRLEAILNTVAGRQKVTQAAAQLGISTQRVSTLRDIALQAALDALAPQPTGRPPKTARSDQERINVLQRKIEHLERELAASKLREEIAVVLPSRPRRGEKKGRPTARPEVSAVPGDGVTVLAPAATAPPTSALALEASLLIEGPTTAAAPAAAAPPTSAAPLDPLPLIEGPITLAVAPVTPATSAGAVPLDLPPLIEGNATPAAASVAIAPPTSAAPLEAPLLIEGPTPLATASVATALATSAAPLEAPLLIEGPTPLATASVATAPPTSAAPLEAPLLIGGSTTVAASAFKALSAPPMLVPVHTCAGLDPTPAPPAPPAKPAPPVTAVSGAVPRGPDEQVHRERLRHSTSARAQRRRAERRDQAWQREQRQRERLVRAEAAAQASAWQDQGVPAREIANLLDCPARTLRYWQRQLETDRLQAHPLGRRHLHCTVEQSQEVIRFLHGHGPWIGMPTLTGAFVGLPAAELRDLLGVFRHLWVAEHPRERCVLHWHQAGTAWAMDFTKVHSPVDGIYPYVFAVRDLASGQQLAWRPVRDMEAATACAELSLLFTIHGAPLILKSDNGSAFLAAATKGFLGRWQVWPLYSPPGEPSYNGSIEASIGSLKKRTQHAAYLAGHAGEWTTADLDRARELANLVARPRGARGPTPQQLWETRRPPTMDEREAFGAAVRQLEAQFRARDGIALEAALDHYEQAALHRRVLQQVLVECGLLTITRRRIPQTFYGQKVANIT